jgi:zinc protease
LNASVSIGVGSASIDTKRAQLAEAIRLAAEVLREPSYPPQEFEELRRAALTRAESRLSDPSAIADERLERHLAPYPKGHWLERRTTEERIADLKSVTLDQAKRCHDELVGASGAIFAAVGDFDPEAVTKLIEELFGNWKSPAPYIRIASRYFERPALEEEVRTPDKANATLRAGLNIELRDDHPDFPALVLGSYLLGGSSAARLPLRVREKEGLSYSTYAFFSASSLDLSASFGVEAIFAPQNKARVETAIRECQARRARIATARARAGRFAARADFELRVPRAHVRLGCGFREAHSGPDRVPGARGTASAHRPGTALGAEGGRLPLAAAGYLARAA